MTELYEIHPNIIRIVLGAYQVNTYLIRCPDTGYAAIIDPGCSGPCDALVEAIENKGLTPCCILNTHGHHDHVQGNQVLSTRLDIPVFMHPEDKTFFLKNGQLDLAEVYDAALDIVQGQIIRVGNLALRVLYTPGHTPGSVCFYMAGFPEGSPVPILFSGDTLFVGDAGRTDGAGGSLDALLESIEHQIMPLPGNTRILPGHDYGKTPESTLDREIADNIYITDFIL